MSDSKVSKISIVLFGQALNVGIQIFFTPYLTRALTVAEYGTYGQVLMLGDIVSVVFSLGLASVIYTYFHGNEGAGKPEIFKTFFVLHLILGLVCFIVLVSTSTFFSSLFENKSIQYLLKLYAFNVFLVFINGFLQTILVLNNLIKGFFYANLVSNLIKIALMLLAVQYLESFELIFTFISIASFVQVVWLLFLIPKEYYRQGIVNWGLSREILSKGFYFGITSILGYAYLYASGFVISYLLTTDDYAIYKAGAIEIPFISLVYNSLAVIILPEVSKMYSEKRFEEIIALKRLLVGQISAFIYPVVIFCLIFSAPFLEFYLSSKYLDSRWVFVIFNLILFFRVNDYHDILTVAGKGKLVLILYTMYFLVCILLNYFLILSWGFYGGALATFLSVFFILFLMQYFTSRQVNVRIDAFFDWIVLFKIVFFSLLFSGLLYVLYVKSAEFLPQYKIVLLGIIAIAYFIVIYKFLIYIKVIEYKYLEKLVGTLPFSSFIKKLI
jgi:O-antigen/teichoic acid export membrane protein